MAGARADNYYKARGVSVQCLADVVLNVVNEAVLPCVWTRAKLAVKTSLLQPGS